MSYGRDPWSVEPATGDCVLRLDGAEVERIKPSGMHTYAKDLYDDYLTPGLAIKTGGSAPSLTTFVGNIQLYAFQGNPGVVNQGFFTRHILHDIKAGTVPTFHVHWSHLSAAPSGNVRWGIEYSIAKGYGFGGFAAPTTVTTIQAAAAQVGGLPPHQTTNDDDMPMTGAFEPDAMLMCRIFRDSSHASDTFAADAFLLHVDLHFVRGQNATTERNRPFTSAGF